MRIGIDCRSLQEPQPSGVSVYTRELLHALVQLPEAAQHEFVFFLNAYSLRGGSPLLASLQAEFPQSNIHWSVRNVPSKCFTLAQSFFSRPSIAWMFGNVDVVFLSNIDFFPVRDTRVPVVLTVHDLSFEKYRECFSLKSRLRYRYFLHPRQFVKRAAAIIAVSQHTKSDLVSLYKTPEEKISVIYPGLREAMVRPYKNEQRQKYILSIATIEPRKNFDTLLEAFALLRQKHPVMRLVIAGGFGWKSAHTLRRMKEIPGVEYLGYVDDAKKEQLYAGASVFVYPSFYEGFGFPPLEAQGRGVPVIAGLHSSLPEVLGESALYADVFDVHSLTRAMDHLMTDHSLRTNYITKGKENSKRFSWQQSAQQTLELLTSYI
ncbi:MAG: glycosyltransferase family 4 protein [Candidatus Kerfeldbacteria bacterium]|nr:glycosyltransferase family 4 protein [Candidatus Kerfeldbacteria bacterium]